MRPAQQCRTIALALAGCLVFLVPFDAGRNAELQGALLVISGLLAWTAIGFGYRNAFSSLSIQVKLLLTVFVGACLLSLVLNPHFSYDFFGSPYIHLGSGGLLACVGIGLVTRTVSLKKLLSAVYVLVTASVLLGILYSWLRLHSLQRIGGLSAQADVLACFAGCGFLLGLGLLRTFPVWRKLVLSAEASLCFVLLLTQTRAIIFLTVVLGTSWLLFEYRPRNSKKTGLAVVALLFTLALGTLIVSGRLTDLHYASQSAGYRLELQHYALESTKQKPVFGYGPGNLADALPCPHLLTVALQTTCDEGYFFNSSHNIYLDRVLAIGWPGGLAFLLLVIYGIYAGFSKKFGGHRVVYPLLLVAGYYCTNVTSLTLELLLWVLLMNSLASSEGTNNDHQENLG